MINLLEMSQFKKGNPIKLQNKSGKELNRIYLQTDTNESQKPKHTLHQSENVLNKGTRPRRNTDIHKTTNLTRAKERINTINLPSQELLPPIDVKKLIKSPQVATKDLYFLKAEEELNKITKGHHHSVRLKKPIRGGGNIISSSKQLPDHNPSLRYQGIQSKAEKPTPLLKISNDRLIYKKISSKTIAPVLSDVICLTDVYEINSPKNQSKLQHYEISQPGSLIKNVPKDNQDSFLMIDNLFGYEHFSIMGVMDGHGTNGHLVSNFIKQGAIDYFSHLDSYKTKKSSNNLSEASLYEVLASKNFQFITSFYCLMENKLKMGKFDVHYSGSTCVMVFLIDEHLICSNTGDSRAILVSQKGQKEFSSHPLSKDHKPGNAKEKARIQERGGIVRRDEEGDKNEPIYRVWIKNSDGPGIAISRTIGDEVASSVGVIPEPEVIEKTITEEMCYVLVASDGIWDFIDNEKVMEIVNPFYMRNDPKEACVSLVKEATSLWTQEGGAIDDITCVVYFLRPYADK